MPSRAPTRVIASAAATWARRAASTSDRPSSQPAASAPLNASPAPVVSMAAVRMRRELRPTHPAVGDRRRWRLDDHGPGRSDRHDDRHARARPFRARGEQRPCLAIGSVTRHRPADPATFLGRERRELDAVGRQHVREADRVAVEAGGRGGIEDRASAGGSSRPQRGANDGRRDLVADEQHVRLADRQAAQRVGDVPGIEHRVGPRRDRDQVLAGRIHQDQRHAGRRARDDPNGSRADPVGRERGKSRSAQVVVAHGPDEFDRGPEPCGRDGLVGALAAVMALEPAVADRLAGLREARDAGDKIHVDRADHDHPAAVEPLPVVHGRSPWPNGRHAPRGRPWWSRSPVVHGRSPTPNRRHAPRIRRLRP